MTSRHQFLAAGAAAGFSSARLARAARSTETRLESRIARRDFRDITRDVLPTPCMVVDLALFEQNVCTMADQSKTTGINVRPSVAKGDQIVDVWPIMGRSGAAQR